MPFKDKEQTRLYIEQKGCCAICKRHQTEFKKRLNIDHCHTTGVVRGLLCQTCNTSLGGFKDNVKNLESAISYLKLNQ